MEQSASVDFVSHGDQFADVRVGSQGVVRYVSVTAVGMLAPCLCAPSDAVAEILRGHKPSAFFQSN